MENIESTSCEATKDVVIKNEELPNVEIVTDPISCEETLVQHVAFELQTEKHATGDFNVEENTIDKIQEIINKVKDEVSKQTGNNLEVYEALTYKTAEMDYIIKVHIGDDNCIHIRVGFPSSDDVEATPELKDIQVNKSKEDEINFL